jgi:hypothetical protein
LRLGQVNAAGRPYAAPVKAESTAVSCRVRQRHLIVGQARVQVSMSEDKQSRSEIDVGAALDAVEAATFEADELLNRVLIWKRMPTDRRIDAFQDAAAILHYNYHAMRFVRRAFERRYEWSDLAGQPPQINRAPLSDAIEDMKEAKSRLGLAFFIFEAMDDPSHWSNIERAKYVSAFERVATALEKVKLAIESLTSLLISQPPDQNT